MKDSRGVLGICSDEESLVVALAKLRENGFPTAQVFSPIPSDSLSADASSSPIRAYTLSGGILGFVSGLALTIGTVMEWPMITGGKPIVSLPPFLVIAFELTILLGGLATFAGLVIHAGLGWSVSRPAYDMRFSVDRYGAFVPCEESQAERVKEFFLSAGAEEASFECA